jgi:hypothetical protein
LRIEKRISIDEWPLYEQQGYVRGHFKQSIETRRKNSEANKGRIYIIHSFSGKVRNCKPEDFPKYELLGYVKKASGKKYKKQEPYTI